MQNRSDPFVFSRQKEILDFSKISLWHPFAGVVYLQTGSPVYPLTYVSTNPKRLAAYTYESIQLEYHSLDFVGSPLMGSIS